MTAERLQQGAHAVACEQLGAERITLSRGHDRQALDRGGPRHVGQMLAAFAQEVGQAAFGLEAEVFADRGLGRVGVDQHHRPVLLGGQAECEIERDERLALALAGAGDHHEIGVADAVGPSLAGALQDGVLDQPELLGRAVDGAVRREQPRPRQRCGIDLEARHGRLVPGGFRLGSGRFRLASGRLQHGAGRFGMGTGPLGATAPRQLGDRPLDRAGSLPLEGWLGRRVLHGRAPRCHQLRARS
jgi:hypothetical protein